MSTARTLDEPYLIDSEDDATWHADVEAEQLKTFDPLVSVFPSCFDPAIMADASLSAVIDRIRSPELEGATERISAAYAAAGGGDAGKKAIDAAKKKLPAVTLSGVFDHRAKENWRAPSTLVGIDLDNLNPAKLISARAALVACPSIVCLWVSPSGAGIKAAVRVDAFSTCDDGAYKVAWGAVTRWLASINLNNDDATKDCSRLAFLAHDSNAYANHRATPLDLSAWSVPVVKTVPGDARRHQASAGYEELDFSDPASARDPLSAIDPDLSYKEWLSVGQALHDKFHGGDDGLRLWDEWSSNGEKYNGTAEVESKYHGFKSSGVSFGTVMHLAKMAGWKPARKSFNRVRPDADEDTKTELSSIILRSHADRLKDRLKPAQMLIEGVFPLGGVGAIVAMPGAGKTLVSVELTRSVAAGEPFMGRPTMQGRVVYACPDSPASTERRLLTIDDEVASRIDSIAEIPALPGSIPALREVVENVNLGGDPVRLIVIDTWDSARSHVSEGYAGQDALIESAMGGLRKMAADLSLSVLIVHHATRGDEGRARGSVVFDARVDWIAVAKGNGHTISLKSTKCRDGERGDLGTFEIQAVDVGGAPVPRLVLVPSAGQTKHEAQDVGKQDYALLKHVVIREGKHSAASLVKDLGFNNKSTVARIASRLRASGYMNSNEYTPTAAGRAHIDSMFDADSSAVTCTDFLDPHVTAYVTPLHEMER